MIKMIKKVLTGLSMLLLMQLAACSQSEFSGAENEVKLITLAPGHFHAALVQKKMYQQVSPEVHIYAPDGKDVELHLNRIESFNTRENNPTNWESVVYKGDDFLQHMLNEKKGNVVILAGNNSKKTTYINKSVKNGLNVLSDKPMAINRESFSLLEQSFEAARENDVLLYDIMTERYEITSQLQRAIAQDKDIFGTLVKGTPEQPAIVKESVHHFFKHVAGSALQRPPWYFDVSRQGEGIVDVTTHLVDLVQWGCFPDEILDYKNDVDVYRSIRWPTSISEQQFLEVTGEKEIPGYLQNNLVGDSVLQIYANGEINYKLKDVHAKVSVIWDYQAPEGGGDTHYSLMRGSESELVVRQGAEQNYTPELFIEPANGAGSDEWRSKVEKGFKNIEKQFPGIKLNPANDGYKVEIPGHYRVGHEAHFAQVTEKYLKFLEKGKLPKWEIPNMLAKYHTTTRALEMARDEGEPIVPDPGVVSYSFRKQFSKDIPATLDMIREMGITNIEFSSLFGASAADLREMLEARELRCTSYGVGYDKLVNNTDQVIDEAKTLGAKYVRVAWIPFEDKFDMNLAQRVVKDFNMAGEKLSAEGLYFCYHNHGYEFRPWGDETLFDYIVQNTNPEHVSFELDLLWTVHPGGDPAVLLDKYPDRFRLVHLKDLKKGVEGDFSGGTAKENDVVLGTGQVDFPAVLNAARNTNVEYYYIEDESPDVEARVPVSRAFIQKIYSN